LNALAEAMLQHTKDCKAAFLTEYIDEKADEFQTALRLLHEKRVNGFIFVGSRIDERAQVLSGLDLPMVFTTVNASQADLPRAASVSIDDRAMAREAAGVLLSRGHTKVAVFGASRADGDSLSQRYKGVKDAFHDAGLTFDEGRYVETRFSLQDAYDSAKAFFAEKPDTTAVFTMSDIVAMGVIRALQDMGKRVPEDVSVFGFDGTDMGKYFIPRLSTVEQPVEELAEQSVLVLTDMLEHQVAPRHVVVEATLRLRESVK
ncbi:MAG: substrate-binding domain-containing protein, partial [Clostridia bacterium]|nr:substrate-binding domain-containing protein [Clostridia bacterium]